MRMASVGAGNNQPWSNSKKIHLTSDGQLLLNERPKKWCFSAGRANEKINYFGEVWRKAVVFLRSFPMVTAPQNLWISQRLVSSGVMLRHPIAVTNKGRCWLCRLLDRKLGGHRGFELLLTKSINSNLKVSLGRSQNISTLPANMNAPCLSRDSAKSQTCLRSRGGWHIILWQPSPKPLGTHSLLSDASSLSA